MKKKIFIGIGIVIIAVVGFIVYRVMTAPRLSPTEDTGFIYNDLNIKVAYSRPYKKGRLIFGDEKDNALVPYGKYWRLGANEATQITFTKNVNFAGSPVNAGTYRMYSIPDMAVWKVVLNSELGNWGYFEPDYDLDVVKVDATAVSMPSETEQFTIGFSSDSLGVKMDFLWDKTLVRVPITLQ